MITQATTKPLIANGCGLNGSSASRNIHPLYGDTHSVGTTLFPELPTDKRVPDWQSIQKATVVLGSGATITVDTSSLDTSIANLNSVRGNLNTNVNALATDLDRFEGDLDNMEQLIG